MFPNPHFNEPVPRGIKYDERSSIFIDVGSDYGVGKPQPIGHTGGAKKEVPTAPMKSFNRNGLKLK